MFYCQFFNLLCRRLVVLFLFLFVFLFFFYNFSCFCFFFNVCFFSWTCWFKVWAFNEVTLIKVCEVFAENRKKRASALILEVLLCSWNQQNLSSSRFCWFWTLRNPLNTRSFSFRRERVGRRAKRAEPQIFNEKFHNLCFFYKNSTLFKMFLQTHKHIKTSKHRWSYLRNKLWSEIFWLSYKYILSDKMK